MSPSSEFVDSGNKISFSNTVNRFSQYIKEKRARGATMNLFPVNEKLTAVEDFSDAGKTINLFPQVSGFHASSPMEVAAPLAANPGVMKPGSREPSSAQMTIFYGGKVIVFNDMTSDKAHEVMDLASNLELSIKKRKLDQSLNAIPNFGENMIPLAVFPNVTDIPLTRKASLHRFLEKRRDRLVGKNPSRSDVPSGRSPKPIFEGNSWLGLSPLPFFEHQQQK